MKTRVDVAQGDLTQAKLAYEMQAEILGQRASSMYRDGSLAAVEVLLDSKSVSDFMSRVKFLNTIGVADADIAKSLRGQKDLLEGQVDELKATQAVAESLEFELKARQIEIMLRIQERQDMVNESSEGHPSSCSTARTRVVRPTRPRFWPESSRAPTRRASS